MLEAMPSFRVPGNEANESKREEAKTEAFSTTCAVQVIIAQ